MFQIGPYQIANRVVLAPMAGVTDLPFRQLCRSMGAGLVVSEMVIADSRLWNSRKSQTRLNHDGEASPRAVQIAGGDPEMLAAAAQLNVERGAQIIDINMGCPAKKVCKKAAGSALLRDEKLVNEILRAVVSAVDVPVTLKIRTGWDLTQRNAITVARMAEDAGIQSLAVHGRSRACAYRGDAEYDTIAEVVNSVSIPVLANGDIDSPQKAKAVLDYTGATAVMIGRAAQGRPWIFAEINHFLAHGKELPAPPPTQVRDTLLNHMRELYRFYGDYLGARIARKHVGWYLQTLPNGEQFRRRFNNIDNIEEQQISVLTFFEQLKTEEEIAA